MYLSRLDGSPRPPYHRFMYTERFYLRVDQEMHDNRVLERLREIGKKRKRSVSFLIREALLLYVQDQEKKDLPVD